MRQLRLVFIPIVLANTPLPGSNTQQVAADAPGQYAALPAVG
jgi:hypothetical protein